MRSALDGLFAGARASATSCSREDAQLGCSCCASRQHGWESAFGSVAISRAPASAICPFFACAVGLRLLEAASSPKHTHTTCCRVLVANDSTCFASGRSSLGVNSRLL